MTGGGGKHGASQVAFALPDLRPALLLHRTAQTSEVCARKGKAEAGSAKEGGSSPASSPGRL